VPAVEIRGIVRHYRRGEASVGHLHEPARSFPSKPTTGDTTGRRSRRIPPTIPPGTRRAGIGCRPVSL